jgi:hypothetical protein
MFVNSFINQLAAQKEFWQGVRTKEEAATITYNVVDQFYRQMANVPIWDMQNIGQIVSLH